MRVLDLGSCSGYRRPITASRPTARSVWPAGGFVFGGIVAMLSTTPRPSGNRASTHRSYALNLLCAAFGNPAVTERGVIIRAEVLCGLLDLIRTRPVVARDRRRASPLADLGRPQARQAGHRPRLRPGHPMAVLAPLPHDVPARLCLPGRHRRTSGTGPASEPGLTPLLSPNCCACCAGTSSRRPAATHAHRHRWPCWRRHLHRARQIHQQWRTYARHDNMIGS
jgi:hypothetical protein